MHILRPTYQLFICILGIFFFLPAAAQKDNYDRLKAQHLYNFPKYIEWDDDGEMEEVVIGVLKGATDFMNELNDVCKDGYADGSYITIYNFPSIKDIKETHILFIPTEMNDQMDEILKRTQKYKTLIVTDRYYNKKSVMLNFFDPLVYNGKLKFELNLLNIYKHNLGISLRILSQGGDEVDLKDLYKEVEEELQLEKQKVEDQRQELDDLRASIQQQKDKIKQQLAEITQQQYIIDNQSEQIDLQRSEFISLQSGIEQQRMELTAKLAELEEQEKKIQIQQSLINTQQKSVDSLRLILGGLNEEVKEKQEKIEEQEEDITRQTVRLEKQQIISWAIGGVLVMSIFIGFMIYRGYKTKTENNRRLKQKNIEIQRQKEEIQRQAHQLEFTNRELEKLSIVASETQNAVCIMDEKGNFEWVNAGFTRMYGYTLQLLKQEKGDNIAEVSGNENIREYIKTSVSEKRTSIYESSFTARNGKEVWTQSTITPIVGQNGQVTKLILIDSDINKIKQAETEIKQQKQALEIQNAKITDSINYAQTIQSAIIPSEEDWKKHFDAFLLYRPRDIVSGDFTWLYRIKDEQHDAILAATIDCTGHGVPGAFMSLVGNRLLNELTSNDRIYQPSQLLYHLDEEVKRSLRQRITDNRDGMDICLCRFDKQPDGTTKVTFSGAKRPLYIYKALDSSAETIRGDRNPIGGIRKGKTAEPEYNDVEVILHKGDVLYLTSDGYTDQNDLQRKSLGMTRFIEVIKQIGHLSTDEQKAILEKTLDQHQTGVEQRDDITVLGIKID